MRLILFLTSLIAIFVSITAGTLTKEIPFSSTAFCTVVEGMDNSPKTGMKWPGMDTYVTSDNVPIPYQVITIEVPLLSKSFEIDEINVHYSRLHKRNLCKRLLHDGAKTQKSWKPLLNTIFVLGGLAEWSVQRSAHEFFCAI